MITLNELAKELGQTEEMGVQVPVNPRHIAEFDQTLPDDADGDYEISDDEALMIAESWRETWEL